MPTVTIVNKSNEDLERILGVGGMQVSTIDTARLQALSQADAAQPDVLVIDVRTVPGIPPAIGAIRREHPGTGIVFVTRTLDPAFLLDAMRAGVNEVVAEPLSPGDLVRAVSQVAGMRQRAEPGLVIGFIGAKGGIGQTTLATNVACALGELAKPQRALLVDVHPFGGDAALFFNVTPHRSITDALENTERLDSSFLRGLIVQAVPHLDLLSAPDHVPGSSFDALHLRTVIDVAASAYRYCVLDLARSDAGTLDSLDRVNTIVLVLTRELSTVKAAARFMTMLRGRYGADKVVAVANRTGGHAEFSDEDIERALGTKLVYTFPSDYRAAIRALNSGRPLVLDDRSELSQALKRFASTLAGARPTEVARRPRLFERVTSIAS